MKKIKYLLLFIALTITLTACGESRKPEEIVDSSIKTLEQLDNYEMKLVLDMSISSGGSSFSMKTTGNSKVDNKSNTVYTKTEASLFGMNVESEGYDVTDGTTTTSYTKNIGEEGWTKEISEEPKGANEVVSAIDKSTKFVEVDSDVKGAKAYETTLKYDDIKGLLDSEDEEAPANMQAGDIKCKIYIKDDKIVKMSMNFEVSQDEAKSTVSIVIEFSKFNEAGSVTVPEDIVKNAKEAEEME